MVRRTRLTEPAQRRLWPDWRHHAFITNVELPTVEMDQLHRDHATVELAIRDLREGAGLEHCQSGRFFANAAWLACAVLAHNIVRRPARFGDVHPDDQLTVTRTVRTRHLAMPARLVNHSRRRVLRLPARWPWPTSFHTALNRIHETPRVLVPNVGKGECPQPTTCHLASGASRRRGRRRPRVRTGRRA